MTREDFKEITEEHFKTCEKIIEGNRRCYAIVDCENCPFGWCNSTNDKLCSENWGFTYPEDIIETAKEFLKFKQVNSSKHTTINTKYGELRICEDEKGAIKITYNTLKNVLVEMRSSNSLVFHTVQPYNNKIETIGD